MKIFKFLLLVAISLSLLAAGSYGQEADDSILRVGSIDFIRCKECGERVLFIPFIEYGYAPSGAHEYTGKVLVQVSVDDTGNVVWAERISGHPYFGNRIANEVLSARFEPKIEFELQVATTEILEFEIRPGHDRDLNKKLPIVNGATESMPYPKFERRKDSNCKREKLEVMVTFNLAFGNVVSAKLISGNPIFADEVERAGLKVRMKKVIDLPATAYSDGVLIYEGPVGTKCRLITVCQLNGRPIDLIVPKFPPAALAVGLKGRVAVNILIDKEGRVISAIATSGHRLFHNAAEEAALASIFFPVTISGDPVTVRGIIVYNFGEKK